MRRSISGWGVLRVFIDSRCAISKCALVGTRRAIDSAGDEAILQSQGPLLPAIIARAAITCCGLMHTSMQPYCDPPPGEVVRVPQRLSRDPTARGHSPRTDRDRLLPKLRPNAGGPRMKGTNVRTLVWYPKIRRFKVARDGARRCQTNRKPLLYPTELRDQHIDLVAFSNGDEVA